MKSTQAQLENRGYLSNTHYQELCSDLFLNSPIDPLSKDKKALTRTAVARYIKETKQQKYIPLLCQMLSVEKKLYTKLEIGDALTAFSKKSINSLIPLLGKIGMNQHKKIGNYDLDKKSYPLPRDIIARILSTIGPEALPALQKVLIKSSGPQLNEAIDAIGHISFNYHDNSLAEDLLRLYKINKDELTQWKLIRAFQGFQNKAMKTILQNILNDSRQNTVIKKEAQRSLLRMSQR